MELKDLISKNYDKYSFGEFIARRRKALGLSLRSVAQDLDVSPPYLADIEKGNRAAPKNHLDKLIASLQIQPSELDDFYDMAHATHGYFYEFEEYLNTNKYARIALRLAKNKNLSDEAWEKIINQMLEDTN